MTTNNTPVAIECVSCKKPILIDCQKFHCVGCSVAMLEKSFVSRSKKERLRTIRQMAYALTILFVAFIMVNHFFGKEIQLLATGFYVLPKVVELVSEKLSRIF